MQHKAIKNKCKIPKPTFVVVFDTFPSPLQCGKGDALP